MTAAALTGADIDRWHQQITPPGMLMVCLVTTIEPSIHSTLVTTSICRLPEPPHGTLPEAAEPDSTEPETEPDSTEPETAEPDSTEPETEPDSTEPETEPDSEPETE